MEGIALVLTKNIQTALSNLHGESETAIVKVVYIILQSAVGMEVIVKTSAWSIPIVMSNIIGSLETAFVMVGRTTHLSAVGKRGIAMILTQNIPIVLLSIQLTLLEETANAMAENTTLKSAVGKKEIATRFSQCIQHVLPLKLPTRLETGFVNMANTILQGAVLMGGIALTSTWNIPIVLA